MNIAIAGAGLIGRLMAWQLLRKGHQVSLFDSDSMAGENSAARVAAAMLAPFSEVVTSERSIFDWGMAALQQWPALIEQLKNDTGNNTALQQRGSIVVAHRQDHNDLEHFNQQLVSRVSDYKASIDFLDQQALQQLEPSLAPVFTRGTFLRDEGCLDNWGLLNNLAAAINTLGAHWHTDTTVKSIGPGFLTTADKRHTFDWTIDTRGFGARQRLSGLRGVRGEVLWVVAPEVDLSRPVRLMHPRYQLYIAPKPGNIYVIGATQIESESLAPMTVRSSLELQSALYSVHTGFAEANIIHAYAHCRAAYLNNLPRIDHEQGLTTINGLYRHGYLLAPVVVQAALDAFEGIEDPALVTNHHSKAI